MTKHLIITKTQEGERQETLYHKSDLFCPCCGKQEVWWEDALDGEQRKEDYICLNCKSTFDMPSFTYIEDEYDVDPHVKSVVEKLKKEEEYRERFGY